MSMECDSYGIRFTFCEEIYSRSFTMVSATIASLHFPVINISQAEFMSAGRGDKEKDYQTKENAK